MEKLFEAGYGQLPLQYSASASPNMEVCFSTLKVHISIPFSWNNGGLYRVLLALLCMGKALYRKRLQAN